MTASLHPLHTGAPPSGEIAGQTVKILRERRRFTIKDIAAAVGMSAGWVSRIESGDFQPPNRIISVYAAALAVPPALFAQELRASECLGTHFRSNLLTAKDRRRVLAHADLAWYAIDKLLSIAGQPKVAQFPEYNVQHLAGGVPEAAARVREHWNVTGPIGALTQRIETMQIMVKTLPSEIEGVKGFTTQQADGGVLMLLAGGLIDETRRHTLAHELGHLVMDRLSPACSPKEKEQRADAFAGELLVPYDAIRERIRGITPAQIDTLLELRRQWGVHPASFIERAYLHGDLSESQRRYWYQVLNARKSVIDSEPCRFPVQIRALPDLLQFLSGLGWTAAMLSDRLNIWEPELASMIDGWAEAAETRIRSTAAHR